MDHQQGHNVRDNNIDDDDDTNINRAHCYVCCVGNSGQRPGVVRLPVRGGFHSYQLRRSHRGL